VQNEAVKDAARRVDETLARLRMDLKNKWLTIIVGAGVALGATADALGKVPPAA
jgi:hypothetical protein